MFLFLPAVNKTADLSSIGGWWFSTVGSEPFGLLDLVKVWHQNYSLNCDSASSEFVSLELPHLVWAIVLKHPLINCLSLTPVIFWLKCVLYTKLLSCLCRSTQRYCCSYIFKIPFFVWCLINWICFVSLYPLSLIPTFSFLTLSTKQRLLRLRKYWIR